MRYGNMQYAGCLIGWSRVNYKVRFAGLAIIAFRVMWPMPSCAPWFMLGCVLCRDLRFTSVLFDGLETL